MTDKQIENNQEISTREKFFYGMTDFADTAVFTALSSYIVIFWTDVAGIAAAATGTIILISKLWDGINDPLMGFIVDRTNSKWGKARPYFKWMPIPFGISAVLVFTAPNLSPSLAFGYALFTYVLVTSMYTTLNIPFGVLGAKMTDDQVERTKLNVWRNTFGQIGGILASALMLPVAALLGSGNYRIGAPLAMLCFVLVAQIIYRCTFNNCRERIGTSSNQAKEDQVELKNGLKHLLANRSWRIAFLAQSSSWIGQGASNSAMAFYCIYVLHSPALIPVFLTASPLFNLVGMLLFTSRLTIRFGKVKTMMFCSLISATLMMIVFFISAEGALLVFGGYALSQFILGPNKSLIFAIFADSIEYGEYKTGLRLEGLTYAGGTMGCKLGAGLAGALVGFVLSMTGYVPDAEQSASALLGIRALVFLVPAISLYLISGLMAINDLDKVYPKALEAINKKRSQQTN